MNDPTWAQWVDELEPFFKQKWRNNRIYELIMLSKTSVILKPELVTSALLFWNTGTNTFDFRMGPMSPTILDMAQVFGLRPSGRIVDVTQDWVPSSTTGSSSSSTLFLPLSYNSATFKSYGTSFKGFIPFVKANFGAGSPRADKDQEHMYFLLYWLNKHIFPNKSKGVRVEWIPLVEILHNFDDVATGPFLLSHLYHLLFEMTQDEPFETNLNGPIWMIQIWLQWYFPEFRAANLEFPEGVAPARILAEAPPVDHSTFACFYFFRVCMTRSDLEWGASVLRRYPWFSDQAFQDATGELANWKEMIQEKNRLLLIAPVDVELKVIESEGDSADAAILHGAAAEAERREAGEGTDISESIGDSEAEGTPKAITKALKRKKVVMAKDPDPDSAPLPTTTRPILTRKNKRARITIPPKSGAPSVPVPEAGPQASKRPILASKEEPLRAVMLKKAEELRNTALRELEATRNEMLSSPEASPRPAREKNLSPSQTNPAEAGASASLPSHEPPLRSMTSSTALDATPSSQFDPSTGVILHFVDEDDPLLSSVYEPPPSLVVLDKEPIVPEIPVASDAAISQAFVRPIVDEPSSHPQDQTQDAGTGSGAALSSSAGGEEPSPQPKVSTFSGETPGLSQQASKETSLPLLARKSKRPHPHSSSRGTGTSSSGVEQTKQAEIAPSIGIVSSEGTVTLDPPHFPSSDPAKLPKLFEALGRLETRLKSSTQPSATSMSSEQQQIFQEWAKKEFTASFSLKALCDLEKVITEFFKTGRLSKPQHDSFLSFFENLRALREQYQRADRQANRAKCFMEKESNSSTQVNRLMGESMQTKERVKVISSEIQQLEEQLVALKEEQATLLYTLEHQIEGVEKATSELEQAKSQLVNHHTVLAEPNRIFTIMRTYHSRIITLCEDVKFLS
ncbi:uncharacterized protein [Malus domestica]|uniref:uncharacterized protein n=1 Tax=Malus domestica TaxID=3750 RepID=UPI0039753612